MFNTKKFCKLHYDPPKFIQFDSSFYLGFLSLNIDESRGNRGRGKANSVPLDTISTCLTNIQSLAERLLQRTHYCAWPVFELEPGSQVFKGKSLTVKLGSPELQRVVIENINRLLQNEYLWYCQETLTCFKQKLRKFSDISTYK